MEKPIDPNPMISNRFGDFINDYSGTARFNIARRIHPVYFRRLSVQSKLIDPFGFIASQKIPVRKIIGRHNQLGRTILQV